MVVDIKWITKNPNKVDWIDVCLYGKLNNAFIDTHYEYVNWEIVSQTQCLKEWLIIKYKDRVNWSKISKFQSLSEEFIEKYSKNVRWSYISEYQTLTPDFIDRNLSSIDFFALVQNDNTWNSVFSDPMNIIKYANRITILNCAYEKRYRTKNKLKYLRGNIKVKSLWTILLNMSNVHAKRIQIAWRRCITDPNYKLCKKRLRMEFESLIMDSI